MRKEKKKNRLYLQRKEKLQTMHRQLTAHCQPVSAPCVWLLHYVNRLHWTIGLIVNSNDFNLFLKPPPALPCSPLEGRQRSHSEKTKKHQQWKQTTCTDDAIHASTLSRFWESISTEPRSPQQRDV